MTTFKKFLLRLSAPPVFIIGVVLLIPFWILTGKATLDILFDYYERKLKN